jgi:hypothetical protein
MDAFACIYLSFLNKFIFIWPKGRDSFHFKTFLVCPRNFLFSTCCFPTKFNESIDRLCFYLPYLSSSSAPFTPPSYFPLLNFNLP